MKLSFWGVLAAIVLAGSAFSAAKARYAISIDLTPDSGGVVRCDPTVRDASSDAIVFQPTVRTAWGRSAATAGDDGLRVIEASVGFRGDVTTCTVKVKENDRVVASRSESRRRA